jgi:hypothetical protein
VLDEAKRIFAELKVPADKAQELIALQAKVAREQEYQQRRALDELADESKKDSEFGGRHWPDTQTKLAKMWAVTGIEFFKTLEAHGAGMHPTVIRGLLKLHDAAGLSEDRLVGGGRAPNGANDPRAQQPKLQDLNP